MAFDTASHKIIIRELQKTNIKSSTLNIIKLLLNSYQTSVNGKDFIKIKRGVPQGSKISPLLFNLFINTLIKQVQGAKWFERKE